MRMLFDKTILQKLIKEKDPAKKIALSSEVALDNARRFVRQQNKIKEVYK